MPVVPETNRTLQLQPDLLSGEVHSEPTDFGAEARLVGTLAREAGLGNGRADQSGSSAAVVGSVEFTVPGMPIGKGRPRFARRGKFVTTYTPEPTATYENLVRVKAAEAMCGIALFEQAVSLTIALRVIPPQSWSARKRTNALAGVIYPTTKPDIDNVIKILSDAMNGIVWIDDKQTVDLVVKKRYADVADATVTVKAL